MGDAFRTDRALRRLFAFLDIGGRPDGVKRPVEAKSRIDVARKFVRLRNDRFKRRPDEGVAVSLAAGQRARITAQKWQVGCKFLAKGHSCQNSLELSLCGVFGGTPL